MIWNPYTLKYVHKGVIICLSGHEIVLSTDFNSSSIRVQNWLSQAPAHEEIMAHELMSESLNSVFWVLFLLDNLTKGEAWIVP